VVWCCWRSSKKETCINQMNIVIISEGRTEISRSYLDREYLSPILPEELGALETIVIRIATEILQTNLVVMGLPKLPPTRPGHTRTASLTQVIKDPELLKQLLLPCFKPPRRENVANAIQGAIVACDEDIHSTVSKSVKQVIKSINKNIVHITFRPEFETILLERQGIEKAANLKSNSIKIPNEDDIKKCGGLKEALTECVFNGGYRNSPPPSSAEFKLKIAKSLSTAYLSSKDSAIMELREHVLNLFTK
jgi:hypothetical protein